MIIQLPYLKYGEFTTPVISPSYIIDTFELYKTDYDGTSLYYSRDVDDIFYLNPNYKNLCDDLNSFHNENNYKEDYFDKLNEYKVQLCLPWLEETLRPLKNYMTKMGEEWKI